VVNDSEVEDVGDPLSSPTALQGCRARRTSRSSRRPVWATAERRSALIARSTRWHNTS